MLRKVLVTSISKKVPMLKAIGAAAHRLDPRLVVLGTDRNPHCLGRYFVAQFEVSPDWDGMKETELLSYCRENSIVAVIPTRDGELVYWANCKPMLFEQGIHVMVSSPVGIQSCLDKLAFAGICRSLCLNPMPTYEGIDDIATPCLVVKERFGAGSRGTHLRLDREAALQAAASLKQPIFQPFIEGQEYSLDIYISSKGKTLGTVARKRDLVVDGESQVTTTHPQEKLENDGVRLAQAMQLYGHIVIQAIQDETGQIFFLECNARFGGASTLSLAAGLDSFYWFLMEAQGLSLEDQTFHPATHPLRQVRFPADWVFQV